MIVTHFNRGPREANYTFEQLFGSIREELKKSVEIRSFDVPPGLSPWSAIRWAKGRVGSINHITGDVNFLSYGLPGKQTILTVHDLGHYLLTLQGVRKWIYRKFWLDGPLRKVAYVTAISEFTKQQLVQNLGISEDKIVVIPDPLLPGFSFSPKAFNEDRPAILQIGSGHNKNLSRLIEAVKGLDVRLILVNQLRDPALISQLKESKIDYEQRANLDFQELKRAYQDCDLLFFASEYEGFGMPILEAQATGRPVITSNLASMPEAAGKGGAVFVNPFSVDEIRNGIEKIIGDAELRENLVRQGRENITKYAIENIAEQYLKVYRSL